MTSNDSPPYITKWRTDSISPQEEAWLCSMENL